MEIKIKDLEKVTNVLLKHLRKRKIKTIKVEHDFYWDFLPGERYEILKNPSKLGAGQLTDDWDNLSDLLTGEKDPLLYDFVWLASILNYIGETMYEMEGIE
ncbi:conserved hypothetical protein [Nitrospina gracilis 3/211]|uniref:Uncharacterized protein n=1 Tax=Nitrospina gracilis (strain 3/211) TaxID=1266370 RepID=M1Z0C5_NITG3|nr:MULTISPECIES: hypothetical protein [Nitrospina]MCF8724295.1 hypothetical protein [Nitrospina sp. Nb-3]CCQ91443.1 conserved hypothetical protein [Nitrospina gracilis 3/211]